MNATDGLAGELARWGAIARRMPPSWRGAGDTQPVIAANGTRLGTMLPGVGLALGLDLKAVGITRSIPNVYERSPMMRLAELFLDERAAITTYAQVLEQRRLGKGQDCVFSRALAGVPGVGGIWFTPWGYGPAGFAYTAIPGGSAPTRAHGNAWNFGMSDPPSGQKAFLLAIGLASISATALPQGQSLYLWHDTLVEAGPIDCGITTSQTVNTTALTRYTTGAGVMCTFPCTTGGGAATSNVTLTYTNQANTGSRSSVVTLDAPNQDMLPLGSDPLFPLASGDYGIRSVQSVQWGTAWTGAVVSIVLYKPLVWMPGLAAPNVWYDFDFTKNMTGLVELATTAGGVLGCIGVWMYASGSDSGTVMGTFSTVWS